MRREAWTITRLTLKMHRFEVALAVGAMVLVTAAAAWFILQMGKVTIPAGCVPGLDDEVCREALRTFRRAANESSLLRGRFPMVFGAGIGVVLGTPIVARELELRTTLLAWSLSARRLLWFCQRLLPMLLVLLVGMAVVVISGVMLDAATTLRDQRETLATLRYEPAILFAQAVMAFGVALLIGALLGRTVSALILSGMLLGAVLLFGVPAAQERALQQQLQLWSEPYDAATGAFVETDAIFAVAYTRFIADGESYPRPKELLELIPPDVDPDAWMAEHVVRERYVVPLSSYQLIATGSLALPLLVGIGAIAAAYVVVSRRRPM
jgi:energy-converting hydrogenase Eha subunit A